MVAACGRYKQSHSSPDKTAPPLLGTVRDLSSGKRVEIGGPLFAFRRQVSRLPPTTDSLGPIQARGFRIRRADRDPHGSKTVRSVASRKADIDKPEYRRAIPAE